VGSHDGVLRLFVRNADGLTLVWRQRLSKQPISSICFDGSSKYCAAACDDGNVFCLMLESSVQRLPVMQMPGRPICLAWWQPSFKGALPRLLVGLADGHVLRTQAPRMGKLHSLEDANVIKLPSLPVAIEPVPALYASQPEEGCTSFFALCQNRTLSVFTMLDQGPKVAEMPLRKPATADSKIDLTLNAAGAAKLTALAFSSDGGYIATAGVHGAVAVLPLNNQYECGTAQVHSSITGGVAALTFCNVGSDEERLLAVGVDGTVYALKVQSEGTQRPPLDMSAQPRRTLEMSAIADSTTVVSSRPLDVDEDDELAEEEIEQIEEPTVLELATIGATVGNEVRQSEARDAIAAGVASLKDRLNQLIEVNASLADDDLEKLTPEDFIIDLAQQQAWREEGSREVETLKQQIYRENLTNELVANRMKKEFWDSMDAPSVTLHAMQFSNGSNAPASNVKASICSYTMPKQLQSEAKKLAQIKLLRKTERVVMQWEHADKNTRSKAPRMQASDVFEAPDIFGYGIGEVVKPLPQQGDKDEKKSLRKRDTVAEMEEEDPDMSKREEDASKPCTEADKMLYSHFSLHTPWRKVSQMTMHSEQQQEIKTKFNVQFNSLLAMKRSEMDRVKEKQARIKEITAELARLHVQAEDDVQGELGLGPDEEPEKVLEVKEHEITAPKFVSKEEREKLARLQAEAEAKAKANAADNLGERGLKHMMNGTLETRREEEEIFKDIVRPEWMDKPADELTDEEKADIKEFEAKVKKLEAEREKRCKGLTTELQKLHTDISDICNAFNTKVAMLADTKMEYDQAVFESEMLCIKLAQARLRKELFQKREAELEAELKTVEEEKAEISLRLIAFKKEVTAQQELVESLSAEDKAQEKAFKRDFMDVPEFIDQLQKLYRRRKMLTVLKGSRKSAASKRMSAAPANEIKLKRQPSSYKSSQINAVGAMCKTSVTDSAAPVDLGEEVKPPKQEGRDPYFECDAAASEQVVEPLDAAVDMPEGLSFDVWDRLVDARNMKVASEEDLRNETARLAEMTTYLTTLAAQEDQIKAKIAAVTDDLEARREAELRASWNLELPFKLKQGQIEVEEAAVVTDFSDALLIHRSEVKNLNDQIRALGAEKVQILTEIRNFRKLIVMLQWENKRTDMEAVDLVERTKEFQLLRVTRDLQNKIRGGSEENQQVEVATLERKLESLKGAHEDKMAELKRQIAKIDRMVADKEAEMASLQGQIEQLEGSVLERKMIHEIQTKNKDASGDGFRRFEEMHMKRKLQTLVGMQTQEVELLREELDRLRRRTFPTFTHTDTGRGPVPF